MLVLYFIGGVQLITPFQSAFCKTPKLCIKFHVKHFSLYDLIYIILFHVKQINRKHICAFE